MSFHQQKYFDILNEYYDKIYVITIPRAIERQEKTKQLLQGLNFSFFEGIDKLEWPLDRVIAHGIYDEALAIASHRYGKPMNLGNIALSYGHQKIYEDILLNQYKRALIFEDDVVPDQHQLIHIPKVLAELPADWELLYWGYDTKNANKNIFTTLKKKLYKIQSKTGTLKWNSTMINNMFPKKVSAHISKAGNHDYSHAYGVTLKGAEKLISWNKPIRYNPDTSLSYAIMNEIIKGYIAHPIVFLQDFQVNPNTAFSLVND